MAFQLSCVHSMITIPCALWALCCTHLMDCTPLFLPKLFPGFAAHYKHIAFDLQHSQLPAGIGIVMQRPLLLSVSAPTDVRSIWLNSACKHFRSTSKLQVHKNHSQYPWKCVEGGMESQNQLHCLVSKTRADLEKYYKTLPLAPSGQCHYRQWCCSQILFHWLPCPFSSLSSEAHFLSLVLHGRVVSLEIHSDEEE